eukprot:CAMPEP_0198126652 /NCGR_PEP_ID=MMETSP1442-20131203/45365_1 /TAXON_ID= /ORGANISM="Craspedostauros australis, Strain CCMP3328" /LENGTH=87 /DNA_ID=CAMNT_0043786477 /DNA_START=113 /DNA_END=372 /DNA_ORIENTATION=+
MHLFTTWSRCTNTRRVSEEHVALVVADLIIGIQTCVRSTRIVARILVEVAGVVADGLVGLVTVGSCWVSAVARAIADASVGQHAGVT